MKLKPYTSVEQYWEFEERETRRQKEAIEALMRRERPVRVPRYAQIFGWLCASAGIVILGYKAIEWLKIAYAGWMATQ